MNPCPYCGSKKAPHLCEPLAERKVLWFPRYLTHVKGRWAGQELVLMDWTANDLIRPMFGLLIWDPELGMWVRQIREVYCEIPRKNAKSTVGAGIGLNLLTADGEEGAEVYSIAEDTDQALVIFDMARQMVEANQALSKICKVYKKLIEVPHKGNIYRVLPGDASGSHGKNVHGLIVDELHTQKSRDLVDVMTSAQGARAQPLTVQFTTAGTDMNSICREKHDYGEKIRKGIIEDPSFLYLRYGVPEDEEFDWEDEQVWRDANPALGQVLTMAFMRSEYRKAKASIGRQNTFRNLYLCEWTKQVNRWLDLGAWDESAGLVDETKLQGRECWGGLDVSTSIGITALCWHFGPEVIWRFWLPAERLEELDKETNMAASGWVKAGYLTLTEGNVIDHAAIKEQVEEDRKHFVVKSLGFRKWGAVQLAIELQGDDDLEVVEIPQTFGGMSAGTKELERLVLAKQFHHNGNAVARYMVDGLAVIKNKDGDVRPDRDKSTTSISGVAAAVMALGQNVRQEPEEEQKEGRVHVSTDEELEAELERLDRLEEELGGA
jgi:phage terminase large subunit-like protein